MLIVEEDNVYKCFPFINKYWISIYRFFELINVMEKEGKIPDINVVVPFKLPVYDSVLL